MSPSLTVLSVLLLPSVTVTPDTVPSRGSQAVVVQVPEPGMYRITATSPEGTACEIVDHLRGPFGSSGQSGETNCQLDLLLDAGVYKVRLASPKRGKGQVKVTAKPFQEINDPVVRLPARRGIDQTLHPGQQASYWIRVDKRRYVLLRAYGRTIGLVRLWRDGRWVEEIEARTFEWMPKDGQPVYEWQVGAMLEAGDYRFTVYGATPKRWSKGDERDFIFVQNGLPLFPKDRATTFTLPAWGKVAFEMPKAPVVAFQSLDRKPVSRVQLDLQGLPGESGDRPGAQEGSCAVAPKALVPTCSAWARSESRHMLTVSGAPGTSGLLEWGRWSSDWRLADGHYTTARTSLAVEGPKNGKFLVAVHDVPVDIDAAPLSCEFETASRTRGYVHAKDFLRIGAEQGFDKEINYNGSGDTVWFEVTHAGSYKVSTSGELKNRCVLYRLEKPKRRLVKDSDPAATTCDFEGHLSPGPHELKIYGGKEGIEKLKIVQAQAHPLVRGTGKLTTKVTKTGCLIPEVGLLDRYEYRLSLNRSGAITTRGLIVRELPLALLRPLPLTVDAGERVHLPVAAGSDVLVRSAGGGKFECAWKGSYEGKVRDGRCRLPRTSSTQHVEIKNTGRQALVITLHRPRPADSPRPLQAHAPKIRPIPKLKVDKPLFFDFDRGQARSAVFDVGKAGLYHVSTQGLLSTECRMRTAVTTRLAADTGSGRGRNCLLQRFLRPGRYLLTARAQGRSRGRAAMLVTEQPVRKGKSIKPGKDVFFQVKANELVRQEVNVKKPGKYELRSTGQGVALNCRLDDKDGWPLVAVPTACVQTREFDAGTYRWTQMPLTVESMRRSRLTRIRKPVVLRGDKEHRMALNTWHTAEIGADGKDTFRFELEADLEVSVSLTSGMQGRIYRFVKGKKEELIQPVPPNQGAAQVKLTAGTYRLVTEHSQADVGIVYRLHIGSLMLAPGLSRELSVPSSADLRMPADGVLRLKTLGETDVRCRLFDAKGGLVTQSGSHGADWNCLIATPLEAGDYRLVLEAENTLPGKTKVSLIATQTRELGVLSSGKVYKPKGKVLFAKIPEPAEGKLQEVALRSKLTFSYILEDAQGRILRAGEDANRIALLIHSRGERYALKLWSKNWYAGIRATYAERPVRVTRGALGKGQAGMVTIPRDGTYKTAERAWCLPATDRGLLLPCGPRASLRAGKVVFSTFGTKQTLRLAVGEVVASLDKSRPEKHMLSERRTIQRQRSRGDALHLLQVRLPFGEPYSPACRIDGGIAESGEHVCYAATAPTRESLARWWAPTGRPLEGQVHRRAARVPAKATRLTAGVREVVWNGPLARLALPEEPCQVELTLPGDAWVVQTDPSGRVLDLCSPKGRLSHCVLTGRGGEVFVASDASRRTRVRTLLKRIPRDVHSMADLYEGMPGRPGELRLVVTTAEHVRMLAVEGAKRCTLVLEDGTQIRGCHSRVPAGQPATVVLVHQGTALRAILHPANGEREARWGKADPAVPDAVLPAGKALHHQGAFSAAAFKLGQPAVVHLHSDTGVCALRSSERLLFAEGMASGCDVYRLLPAGSYRFLVRSFAGRPLSGSMAWTRDVTRSLSEGVGREEWLAPGETRIFRFRVKSAGGIGLGLRVEADALSCHILAGDQRQLGGGCQQLIHLEQGDYLLRVQAPPGGPPRRFRPVLLGLSGSMMNVPEEYLRDFFRRIGD